ncbi:MAG TPA: hypothetical protein VLX11_12880 [Candidatus Acidoferrales bacterium]|nr:hypothetical protein [Candidatus Acidoferrales bacterium]
MLLAAQLGPIVLFLTVGAITLYSERGIRIGGVKDGKVLYRIPDPLELKGTSVAEGLTVDARGNVCGGEVGPRQLVKHTKE